MTYPLMVLAGCAVLAGLVFGPTHWFEHHLEGTLGFEGLGHGEHGFDLATALVSTIAGLVGIGLAYRLYAEPSPMPARLARQIRPLYEARCTSSTWMRCTTGWWSRRPGRWPSSASSSTFTWWTTWCRDRPAARKTRQGHAGRLSERLLQFYAAVSALGVAVLLCGAPDLNPALLNDPGED